MPDNGLQAEGSDLRDLAEKKLREKLPDLGAVLNLNREEVERLVHELQVHQVELEIQAEELRRAQAELETLKDKYRDLYDFAPVGYITVGENGLILEANLTACRILDMERRSLIDQRFSRFVHRDDQDCWYLHLRSLLDEKAPRQDELRLVGTSGVPFHAQLDSTVTDCEAGRSICCRTIISDCTERKKSENLIRASLKEEEILLREIHHRVKNNLEVISSLLRLQASYARDGTTHGIFQDTEARIRSMALIQESLYRSPNLAAIPVGHYLNSLVDQLVASLEPSGRIQVRKEIAETTFEPDTLVPLGLLTTELVTNSLRHAFPATRDEGELSVSVKSIGDKEFELVVADNGIGLTPDIDLEHPRSIGFDLVGCFVDQLHGSMVVGTDTGTEIRIRFKEIKRPRRR